VILKNTSTRGGLILAALASLGASNCAGLPPSWNADFWLGDSASSSLVRCVRESDDGKECVEWAKIPTNAPAFDDYVCVTHEHLQRLHDEVLARCEKWR
jgi:hypothetical protein